MSPRAMSLAQQFGAAANAFIQTLDLIPDEAWSTRDPATGWTVAATAHHVAERFTLYMGIADTIARREPVPEISRAMLDRINAEHARDHRDAGKRETLVLVIERGEKVQRALARLADEQLEATATIGFVGDMPITTTQFIEDWVIGHIVAHLSSLRGVAEVFGEV